jgi:hypothetical protein
MNRAYVAGFFDGEGCVGFSRARRSVFPRILVTNTNRAILEELRTSFGGDIKPLALRRKNWKQGWSWRLSWSAAVSFLAEIKPWLQLKNAQAETVFAWDAIRLGRGRVTSAAREEYDDTCALLINRMRWLNRKGPHNDPDPIDAVLTIALKEAGKSKKK